MPSREVMFERVSFMNGAVSRLCDSLARLPEMWTRRTARCRGEAVPGNAPGCQLLTDECVCVCVTNLEVAAKAAQSHTHTHFLSLSDTDIHTVLCTLYIHLLPGSLGLLYSLNIPDRRLKQRQLATVS